MPPKHPVRRKRRWPARARASGSRKAVESGQDSVQISGLSARISAVNQQEDARESDRVSTLAALYAHGKYQVDAENLSHALVSHALSGATEGDEA